MTIRLIRIVLGTRTFQLRFSGPGPPVSTGQFSSSVQVKKDVKWASRCTCTAGAIVSLKRSNRKSPIRKTERDCSTIKQGTNWVEFGYHDYMPSASISMHNLTVPSALRFNQRRLPAVNKRLKTNLTRIWLILKFGSENCNCLTQDTWFLRRA